jgi:rRNA maturation RNase YbeY
MSRTLVIRNRQRTRPVDTALLRRIALSVLTEHLHIPSHELCFHLVDAEEMARVNETFLQHTGSTDVITFDHAGDGDALDEGPITGPLAGPVPNRPPGPSAPALPPGAPRPLHGEIFISIPDALAQAEEFNSHWTEELTRYVIHGLLHLVGYDDLRPAARRLMKRAENRLVVATRKAFPLQELSPAPASPPPQPRKAAHRAAPPKPRRGAPANSTPRRRR